MVSEYNIQQCGYRIYSSFQKVLLDRAFLDIKKEIGRELIFIEGALYSRCFIYILSN